VIKNTASQKVGVQMVAAADGSAFTSAVTVSVTGDAGTQATGSVGSGACTHEGNGYHTYAPAQAETNYDLVAFTFTGTGAVPQTVQVYTRLANPTVDVDTIKTNPVVNAGTLTFPTGATLASTTNITAGTLTTVTTATNVTTVNGLAAGVITAASIAADAITDAKVASDVTIASVTGAVGSVTGNVGGNVTGSVGSIATGGITSGSFAASAINAAAIAADAITDAKVASDVTIASVTGAVGSVTGAVGSVTGAVGSVTGNVGGNVTGSVGSVATGGITAASIASGAIDRDSFAADTGLQSVRSNTAQAGAATTITLDASASSTTDFYAGMGIYLTGGTGAGQSNVITAYNGTTKVATVRDTWLTNPDNTTTFAIFPGADTAADIADAVWDELLSGHAVSGSAGEALSAAGTAGDPWTTALPGAYGAGTAGKIIGDNINAAISSRASQTSVDTVDDLLDTELAAVKTDTAAILIDTNELQTDWVNGGRLDLILDARASQTSVDAVDDLVDTEIAALMTKLTGIVPVSGTIGATGNTTTALHLSGIAWADDGPNSMLLTIQDVSTGLYYSRWIEDFATTGDLATVATLPFTPEASVDLYWVTAVRADVTGGSGLDAAGVRAAIGLASANLDTQLADLPTNAELATSQASADDATLAAIATLQTSVDDLPTNAELATSQAAADDATLAVIATLQTSVDDLPTNAELATALGTADDATLAAVAAVNAKIDIIDTNVDDIETLLTLTDADVADIKAKTDSLTFTEAGVVDANANVTAINGTDVTGDGALTPWGPA
jgi:hypothetical protein